MMSKALYEEVVEAQLRDWSARFEKVKAMVSKADPSARNGVDEEMKRLERRKEMLRCRLEELKACHEDGWQLLQEGLERTRAEAADALAHLARRLNGGEARAGLPGSIFTPDLAERKEPGESPNKAAEQAEGARNLDSSGGPRAAYRR